MQGLRFDRDKIKKLLQDFYILTKIRIGFLGSDLSFLETYPKEPSMFCTILREDQALLISV